jgi:hypothetical protein
MTNVNDLERMRDSKDSSLSFSAKVQFDARIATTNMFADFAITSDGSCWYFGSWKTPLNSLRIYFPPGAVIVWGDLGDAVFRHSGDDSLEWLLRAASDRHFPDYCLGKLAAIGDDKQEFFTGDALSWLLSLMDAEDASSDDVIGTWEQMFENLENGCLPAQAWYLACREHGIDDPPRCEGWSWRALVIWNALATFVRLYNERSKRIDDCKEQKDR